MTTNLKPYPFCGSKANFYADITRDCNDYFHFIECTKCGISTEKYINEHKPIEKWNTRQPPINWQPIVDMPKDKKVLVRHEDGEIFSGERIADIVDGFIIKHWVIDKVNFSMSNSYNFTHFAEITAPALNEV